MNEYVPVACSFHDRLEHLAMRRTTCRIRYREDGSERVVEGRIKDIVTTGSAEFLVLAEDAGRIRLDYILDIGPADVQPR